MNQHEIHFAGQSANPGKITINERRSTGRGAGKLLSAEMIVGDDISRRLRTQEAAFRRLEDYDRDPMGYEDVCAELLNKGAPELVHACRHLQDRGLPALLAARNLHIDDTLVPTPLDGVFDQRAAPVELGIQTGITRSLGIRAVAFSDENDGRIVRAVCPVRALDHTASSQGAKADLKGHTDNGHLPIPHSNDTHPFRLPAANAYQSFTTITPMPTVPMRVQLLDDVLANLDPAGGDFERLDEFADLQRAEFRYSSPPSHGGVHRLEPLPAIVSLDDPDLGYGLRYHGGTMVGITPRAEAALELLRFAVARAPEYVIHADRGDVILYDNRRVLHRREPYAARFDGTDRYHLRLYGQPEEDVERWARALPGNGRVA